MDKSLSYVKFKPEWGVSPPSPLPQQPAYTILTDSARKWPEKVALICCGRKVTYEELNSLSDKLAQVLVERFGVKKGSRVATMMPNCIQHTVAFFAILKAGAVAVPCNVMYKPRELAYQINDAEVETILALDTFYPIIAEVIKATGLENIILTNIRDFAERGEEIPDRFKSDPINPPNTHDFIQLISESDGNIDYAITDIEDLAMLLYTAGTTGQSKGVMEANRNIWACALPTVEILGFEEQDVNLQVMPMFHCSGYCLFQLPTLLSGGTVVHVPLFDPKSCIQWIAEHNVSVIFAPPTFYVGLMNEHNFKQYKFPSLRITFSGGAPQPEPLRLAWEKATGLNLLNGYGMTETMCQGASVLSLPNKYRIGAIGSAFNCEVKIVNDKGEIVERGTIGEIMFKGVGVAKGYWKKPEETAKAYTSDGWLHSGDAGYMDDDDFIYFVDRYKDLIVTSGYNVAPAEIESIIMSHPSVKETAVIGVPDEYKGEAIKAFVSLKEEWKREDIERLKESILEHCRKELAAFKVPKFIEIADEIPKSPVGKILRRKLRTENKELEDVPRRT